MKTDVIILNWNRPEHVRDYLIPTLLRCGEVHRIIVSHGKIDTRFEHSHPRVISIDHSDLNADLGLALRFHCHSYVTTDAVLLLDDDQFIEEAHVRQLAAAFAREPGRIHGYHKRYVFHTRHGLAYGRMKTAYRHFLDRRFLAQVLTAPPRPMIALTKTLMAPAAALRSFCEHQHLVDAFVARHSNPLWNGEDIFFCLLHYAKTGVRPVFHKAHPRLAETKQSHQGISSRKREHFAYRDAFVRHACDVLGLDL